MNKDFKIPEALSEITMQKDYSDAKAIVSKVNELFHLQQYPDWENKAIVLVVLFGKMQYFYGEMSELQKQYNNHEDRCGSIELKKKMLQAGIDNILDQINDIQ